MVNGRSKVKKHTCACLLHFICIQSHKGTYVYSPKCWWKMTATIITSQPTVVSAQSLQLISGLTIVSIPCSNAESRIRWTENFVRNSCAFTGSGRNRDSTVTRAAMSLSRSAECGRRWSSSHSETLRRTLQKKIYFKIINMQGQQR